MKHKKHQKNFVIQLNLYLCADKKQIFIKKMKKILKTIGSIAAAATIIFSSACNKGTTTPTQNSAQPAALSEIAYVNIDSLLDQYDMYNDLRTQLMAKQQKMEQELQTKGKSLERKALELQQNYEKRLVTPTRAQEIQQNLAAEQQRLLQQRDQGAMELADDERRIMSMVSDSVQNYIKEYNADNRFKLIINKAGLLYGDKSLDITEPIIKALNDRYNAAGQKATVPVDTTAKK